MDEPIVETLVDPPDTMPVTRASVEMATGPPAPPAPPEVLCKALASFTFIQSSRRLTDPDPDPDPEAAVVEAVPLVDVTVTVPVADVTVTMAVVLAPEPAAARAANHRLAKPVIHVEEAQVRDKKIYTYRNSTMYHMIRRQTLGQHRKLVRSSREDHSQNLHSYTSMQGRGYCQGIQEKQLWRACRRYIFAGRTRRLVAKLCNFCWTRVEGELTPQASTWAIALAAKTLMRTTEYFISTVLRRLSERL